MLSNEKSEFLNIQKNTKIRRKSYENKGVRKCEEGITLVALVVTIIVLLILAGVSLSAVFSQDGIFSRAEQGADKHGQAKARETLELALGEAQMQKYEEELTDEQLDNKIGTIQGELLPKEKPEYPNLQNVIVDGYIFEIDRSVPKIVDYIGPADGVIITAVVTQNGNWQAPVATLSGTIKTYSGGNITSSTATVVSGNANVTAFPTTGGNYTIGNITEDTSIKINATDSTGKKAEKIIPVRLVRDTTAPTLSEIDTTGSVGLTIKFKASATDNESGLKEGTPLHYTVTPTTGLTTSSGDFASGATVELTSSAEATYTITVTAQDKAGNTSAPKTAEVVTMDGGVIKHIKTPSGLQEVNTKMVYGSDILGYNCTRKKDDGSAIEWQLFYIDEEDDHRVYLIAKDYMVPPTTGTELTKSTDSNYPKAYYWTSAVLNKYTGTIPNTPFTAKFLSDYAGTSASGQANYQATNYMLDQSMWAEYYNNTKADYAFGGPTLPLFQASYNDTSRTATRLGIQKRTAGYQINQGGGSWSYDLSGYGDTNTQNGIYFKGNESNSALAMWLASPSATGAEYVMDATYGGRVGDNPYSFDRLGFRPIVELKSDVTFTDNGNGTYTIN